jgi:hypothetical protein
MPSDFWDRPLAVDLFTGLHGWADGLIAEGWSVIGVDIEDMSAAFGQPKPDYFQLILQNILTLHGSQFRNARLIVCSPPCQAYSYRAMPWSRAKALPPPCNELFEACFRIQREASEAAGRRIPLIVENVRGAQPWVGRARWTHGSYALWGDVPALMPISKAFKSSGMNWSDRSRKGQDFTRIAGLQALSAADGIKLGGSWFHGYRKGQGSRNYGSNSLKRKQASALIAKIPFELSLWIAQCFKPIGSSASSMDGATLASLPEVSEGVGTSTFTTLEGVV